MGPLTLHAQSYLDPLYDFQLSLKGGNSRVAQIHMNCLSRWDGKYCMPANLQHQHNAQVSMQPCTVL